MSLPQSPDKGRTKERCRNRPCHVLTNHPKRLPCKGCGQKARMEELQQFSQFFLEDYDEAPAHLEWNRLEGQEQQKLRRPLKTLEAFIWENRQP